MYFFLGLLPSDHRQRGYAGPDFGLETRPFMAGG